MVAGREGGKTFTWACRVVCGGEACISLSSLEEGGETETWIFHYMRSPWRAGGMYSTSGVELAGHNFGATMSFGDNLRAAKAQALASLMKGDNVTLKVVGGAPRRVTRWEDAGEDPPPLLAPWAADGDPPGRGKKENVFDAMMTEQSLVREAYRVWLEIVRDRAKTLFGYAGVAPAANASRDRADGGTESTARGGGGALRSGATHRRSVTFRPPSDSSPLRDLPSRRSVTFRDHPSPSSSRAEEDDLVVSSPRPSLTGVDKAYLGYVERASRLQHAAAAGRKDEIRGAPAAASSSKDEVDSPPQTRTAPRPPMQRRLKFVDGELRSVEEYTGGDGAPAQSADRSTTMPLSRSPFVRETSTAGEVVPLRTESFHPIHGYGRTPVTGAYKGLAPLVKVDPADHRLNTSSGKPTKKTTLTDSTSPPEQTAASSPENVGMVLVRDVPRLFPGAMPELRQYLPEPVAHYLPVLKKVNLETFSDVPPSHLGGSFSFPGGPAWPFAIDSITGRVRREGGQRPIEPKGAYPERKSSLSEMLSGIWDCAMRK